MVVCPPLRLKKKKKEKEDFFGVQPSWELKMENANMLERALQLFAEYQQYFFLY